MRHCENFVPKIEAILLQQYFLPLSMPIYRYIAGLYLLPFLFLLLFVLTEEYTDATFLALFFLSLFPCGLLGLILTFSWRRNSLENTDKQGNKYASAVIGGMIIIAGLIGLGLLYIVTS